MVLDPSNPPNTKVGLAKRGVHLFLDFLVSPVLTLSLLQAAIKVRLHELLCHQFLQDDDGRCDLFRPRSLSRNDEDGRNRNTA